MRHLAYYPMIHVSSPREIAGITKLLNKLHQQGEISPEQYEKMRKVGDFEFYQNIWRTLLDFLKEQKKPFDKTYLESFDGKNWPAIAKGSVMDECMQYLKGRGTKFMPTESPIYGQILDLAEQVESERLEKYAHRGRERSTVKSIDQTLLDGERAILFFGADHKEQLVKRLKLIDVCLEII